MEKKLIKTADGSFTFYISELDESYSSTNGALQESLHVFVEKGLKFVDKPKVRILEMGFGSGLNALVSIDYALQNNIDIEYTGVEAYPISYQEALSLNYVDRMALPSLQPLFNQMHLCEWGNNCKIAANFDLLKLKFDFRDVEFEECFDIVYFDAFAPTVQEELWSESVFKKMHSALVKGGILVTYSSKGSVRRAMKAAGFTVEKLEGPPGKWEMCRAKK